MDRLQQIRVFTKVVERGSLSRAARDLGVTQPTVSKALAALENELKQRLLLRSTRRVTVTDSGRRYYDRCREVIETLDEAEAELADDETPRGTLRVHGPVVLGEMFIGPAAVQFQRRHPNVRCELTFLDSYVDLVAEGADLAIRLGHVTDPSIVRRRVGAMKRVLVASPEYLAKNGTPKEPADLAKHAAVRFSGLPSGNSLSIGGTTIEMTPGFLSNNAVTLRDGLLGGLGIGLVTEWLVHEDLKKKALVEVLPETPPAGIEVNVVFPTARFVPRRARMFVEFFMKTLKRTPGMSFNA